MWYCRISGLPYIFSNAPCPAAWDAGGGTVVVDGETYTWSPTLLVDGPIEVQRRADPIAGVSEAGLARFRFKLLGTTRTNRTDVWLDLIATAAYRDGAPVSVMNVELAPNGSVVGLASTADWPSSGDAYANVETISYDAKSASQLQTLTRGAYGSEVLNHPVDFGGILESKGGALVTDHATVHEGRFFELWLAPGRGVNRRFVPYGSTIMSAEDGQYWAGPVLSASPDRGRLAVGIETASLDQVLAREVATALPRGVAGLHPANRGHQLAADCNRLAWQWEWGEVLSTGEEPAARPQPPVELQTSGGVLADGVYTDDQLAAAIGYTLFSAGVDIPHGAGASWAIDLFGLTNRKMKLRVRIYDMSITASEYTWLTLDARAPNSFWRLLGFEGEVVAQASTAPNTLAFEFVSDRSRPQLYLPVSDAPQAGRKLYYHMWSGPEFDASPGWVDDNANAINGYARVGSECVEFTATGADAGGRYITVSRRAQLGSELLEHYIEQSEDDQKTEELRQGIALPGCTIGRIMAYLAAGGSGSPGTNDATYDQGWWGSGAHIPARFLDLEGWVALGQALNARRDQFAVFEAVSLRDLFAPELKFLQSYLVQGNVGGSLKLKLLNYHTPYEADIAAAAYNFDYSNTNVDGPDGVGCDTSTEGLVNAVEIRIGYNHATGEFRDTINAYDVQSIATYGRKQTLSMELKSIGSMSEAVGLAQDLANRVFSSWGHPRGILDYLVTRASFWALEIGDDTTITDPLQPSLPAGSTRQTIARGVEDLPAVLMVQRMRLPGAQEEDAPRGNATLVVGNLDGRRTSKIVPGAECYQLASTTELRFYDHVYSAVSAPLRDVEHFQVGWVIRLYNPGDEAASEVRTITAINLSTANQSTIEIDTPTALSATIIIEFADYDQVTDEQRRYVYMSDGDGKLDRTGATDPPYKYA